MNLKLAAGAILAGLIAGPAFAQSSTPLGQFKDWSAWSYAGSKGKVCYIFAEPEQKLPGSLDHGDISFFIRTSPGENIAQEANFVAGYTFKDDSKVSVTVDGKDFEMFTQGDSAWLVDPSKEADLLGAMKAGSDMTVTGMSKRGNKTTYKYSLSGVTAASGKIETECK